jgi:hypothetical protein
MRALLIGLVVVFSISGCSGSDSADESSVELPAAAAEAYENYTEALLDANGDAMLNYVTAEFTFLSYGTDVQEREFRADYVTTYYKNFAIEETGERTVVGGGDTYIFSVPERVTTPVQADGISVVKMVEIDGIWLVESHRFLGEGEGSA